MRTAGSMPRRYSGFHTTTGTQARRFDLRSTTSIQIARELSLGVSTYRARILEKMDMKNSSELTHYAVQKGVVN